MPNDLLTPIADTAFAFRGYNVTNLGRTRELLEHNVYGSTVAEYLRQAGKLCSVVTGRRVDLMKRVVEHIEPTLNEYAEALALIMAVELAHVQLLSECHGVAYNRAKMAFGYSLGELTALTCGGAFTMDDVLRIPLAMASDAAALAHDVKLGVLFSRGPAIAEGNVHRLCLQITAEGGGTVSISSILSPNTYLLLGQHQTLKRFKSMMHDWLPAPVHLRLNDNRWPPLHTPIVRQKHITDRSSVMMEVMEGGFQPPCPTVFSLATGKRSYDDVGARDVIRLWIDHPQRLWDAIRETLACGIKTVIHVGPEPNLIPATFRRLGENITEQTSGTTFGSLGMRAAAGLARRPWLSALLPAQATLLRAPSVRHVILEDWLLANAP